MFAFVSNDPAPLNFDTETVYDDGSTRSATLPPGPTPVAAPAMQTNDSLMPRRGSKFKTPPKKRTAATSMVTPEKRTSFVFKKSDVKPVVHLAAPK